MKNIVLVKGSVVGSVGEGGGREEEGGGGSVSQPFVLWLRVPTVGYAMTGATMETAVLVLDQPFQSRAIPDVVVLNVLKDVGLTL